MSSKLSLVRTSSNHPDFIQLVQLLDQDLAIRDGAEHVFYAQFNKIAALNEVLVAYLDLKPVSCGAFKTLGKNQAEIKRMYTLPEVRGQGFAAEVLGELEKWARELGFDECVLETGKKQPEAIRLYEKCGYTLIPNYGQYIGIENSVCMKKILR